MDLLKIKLETQVLRLFKEFALFEILLYHHTSV